MENTFGKRAGGYRAYESEISKDSLEFHSAGKKYINQNYKRIGSILGIEEEWLRNIKKQASAEEKLPDIQGELSLKQINSYREHYDFPPLTQDEYEAITAQNNSAEVIIDEQLEADTEEATEVDQTEIDLEGQESTPTEEVIPTDPDTETEIQAGVELVQDAKIAQSEDVISNTNKTVKGIDGGLNTILNKYLSQNEINTSDVTTAVEPESVTTPEESEITVELQKSKAIENPTISGQPLTNEQLENNKKLYGWMASYELAKIAKSQNVDLSLLSREDYADFAIQNKLMIDDTQLRMSPWQRICESVDEVRKGDKDKRALINPEAAAAFDKFSLEMRQKAGEYNTNIDNDIVLRRGTKDSEHWLFFAINQGSVSQEDKIFKSYVSLKDLNSLTPEKFTDFMQALRDSGYNGDIKIFQDLLSQGVRLNDQIVMHGDSEADAKLGLDVADQFFNDSLENTSLGVDMKVEGKYKSYSQILAQKIKDSIQDNGSVEEQNLSTEGVESNRQDVETDTNLDELQQELDRLITLESQKLQREQTTENFSYQVDREKLENFKENARQAITNYQQFATEHSSPLDKANVELQEKYRQLEKKAWDTLYNLAHALDGEIATLPQDRDIQLSHPEGVDIRQYLEARGYKFDEKGDITHINDNGVEIELNRAMKTDSLIKSRRPSRILYDKSVSLDNDMNYQGYLVRGLNPQTPDFIVGVLDKEHLESVIVDDTLQSNNLSEGIKDPWAEQVKGETEFDKIFADSLKQNDETQISDEISDPWTEKSVTEEPPIIPVFPIPSGDNPDLQSEGTYPLGEEGPEATTQVSLDDLRLAYARAEEAYNRKRGDWDLENAFEQAREVYNTELERVLKLKVAEGQESSIHDLFKNEVISLREERITQSKELQGHWEKKLNPLKEKFVNFVIKHKKIMGRVNLGLGIAGGALALTGVGIPLAGGLAVTRRAISGILLGVSSGEGVRSLGEDADINLAWGRIKFKAIIPKLVQESLASSEDEFKKVKDDVLKDRLGTLEAYYRLNGGKFTNDDQQKAYEKVLTELGNRVKVNTIGNYQNENASNVEVQQDIIQDSVIEQDNQDTNSTEQFNSRESRYYVSEMLNTISDKRVQELDKFKINRRNATIAGLGVGILVGGAVHAFDEVNKPDSIDVPESLDAETQINPTNLDSETDIPNPGADLGTSEVPPAPELPPAVDGEALSQSEQLAQSAETARVTAEQAVKQAAEQLAQDVSSLDPGETIWGEIAKQLGENATDTQIQQAVENLLQSEVGQNSIYELAQGTEGGRTLLVQWGIDNANEMAELSKEQLYEISKYLAPGELQGISELSLDNLNPFDAVEPPQVDVSEAMDASDTSAVEAPTPSVEPTPLAPPEVSPIAGTEFTESLSKALGVTNLTETQLQEVITSFANSEQGGVDLYNQIISNTEGARFLSGFGVNSAADFANLRPDELYEIVQIVGVENLDSLPGFELNEIILSRFEDAPDFVELAKGSKPLDVVNRYIANEVGNLPYDASIGQQVLNTYLDTPAGKDWLYEAVINNPDKLNGNQNIQFVEEYFRQKGIKSGADINWIDLTQDRRFPTSIFWRETVLTGGKRIPPLSTLLQPGQMIGIKESIRQVLTKQ